MRLHTARQDAVFCVRAAAFWVMGSLHDAFKDYSPRHSAYIYVHQIALPVWMWIESLWIEKNALACVLINTNLIHKYTTRGFRSIHSESHLSVSGAIIPLSGAHTYALAMLYGLRNPPPRWICNASSRMCVHLILTLCSLSRLLHPSVNLWRCSGFFSKGLITQKVFLIKWIALLLPTFLISCSLWCVVRLFQCPVQPCFGANAYLWEKIIYKFTYFDCAIGFWSTYEVNSWKLFQSYHSCCNLGLAS